MSKIDPLVPRAPININRPGDPNQLGKTEQPVVKSERQTDTQQLRDRISHWFAQAGVSPARAAGLEQDGHKRIQRRRAVQQQRRLQNLERVLELALEFCPTQGTEENLDADWFFNFVQMAEDIYSPGMQELWGKIFAAEISHPGSFSLRSLTILRQLTQRDAKVLSLAVSLSSRKRGDYSPRILYGYYQKPTFMSLLTLRQGQQLNLAQYGLTYPDLLALMDLGLIYNSEIESGEMDTSIRTEWRCSGETLHLAARYKGSILKYYKFTATGAELSRLVPGKPQPAYVAALRQLLSGAFEVS
ncbi:TIGR03899 family protein [Bowmanella dokdonensis]|uniref:TIGR03899 family protein n=1 Tax=Bowmanella dokdonensis TaxID=751969 RepID=A0A939ISP8_9ALTE|nr:TIGR03899 family protein [Bowmanella dokdonensis]MBN7827414.1 TIGR03899 family protein [Bowmanella dokdonensis]